MVRKSKKRDVDIYMSALGSHGGSQTLKKYGPDHFRKLAEKRWSRRKTKKVHESISRSRKSIRSGSKRKGVHGEGLK